MSEKAALAKTSGKKAKEPVSKKPKENLSHSMDSPVEQILQMQQSIGNREVRRLIKSGKIQAKLTIGKPNDKYEQEADRISDRVMSMPEPKASSVQRKPGCPDCPEKEEIQTKSLADQITPLAQRQTEEDEEPVQTKIQRQETEEDEDVQTEIQRQADEEEPVQAKPAGNKTAAVTPNIESNINSLKVSGQPLPESTRSYFEPRFGADFSQVRVHTGSQAAETAKSVNAKAFTKGKDVVFGAGQYSPGTSSGKNLLAHELTHVVQQERNVMCAVERWRKKAAKIPKTEIEKWVGESYWGHRIGKQFRPDFTPVVSQRFKQDPEERDAVYSVLWEVRPRPKWRSGTTRNVKIPARKNQPSSKPLVYQFIFKKKSSRGPQRVEIQFFGEGKSTAMPILNTPPSNFTPPAMNYSFGNFPDPPGRAKKRGINDFDYYMSVHPGVKNQLFYWVKNQTLLSFDQVVIASVTSGRKSSRAVKSVFRVKGGKDMFGKVTNLVIYYIKGGVPQTKAAPAGYTGKEGFDWKLEQLQSSSRKKSNRLGAITGVSKLPALEKTAVKYAIWQYFKAGKTRNAEVDLILPIPKTSRKVYYTFQFEKNTNNVSVTRVSEKGDTGFSKIAPDEMALERVKGYYDSKKQGLSKFKAWLNRRYPKYNITGTSIQSITTNVNFEMRQNANKPKWFADHYQIYILNAANGKTRLKNKHRYNPRCLKDMKDYTAAELVKFEFALQRMSLPRLSMLKGTRMVRQGARLEWSRKRRRCVEIKNRAGQAVRDGNNNTVIIFTCAFENDDFQFIGGKEGIRAASTSTFAHELGHIIGLHKIVWNKTIQQEFNKFVKKKKIKPVSAYAAKNKKHKREEFFPEALSFYLMDPEFMKNQQFDLYDWFEKLSKTGKPPPLRKPGKPNNQGR